MDDTRSCSWYYQAKLGNGNVFRSSDLETSQARTSSFRASGSALFYFQAYAPSHVLRPSNVCCRRFLTVNLSIAVTIAIDIAIAVATLYYASVQSLFKPHWLLGEARLSPRSCQINHYKVHLFVHHMVH